MVTGYEDREARREREFAGIWTNELEAAFSHIAAYYDRANSVASLGLWNRWRRQFVAGIRTEPGHKILDVCAGTNAIGIALLNREPSLEVHAIDRSAAMQEVGQEAAGKHGFQVQSVVADVHKLPYEDNSFDVVTLEAASRHLRVVEVFSEVNRVLRPGGRFHHCDMLRPKSRAMEDLYCAYLTVCLRATGLIFRSGSDAWSCKEYFVKAIRMFYSADEISTLLRKVGFTDVSDRSIMGGMVAFHGAEKV